MPYKKIHWVKLEKRLLNDYRYYSMSERARLLFVELLMVAADTQNRIPQDPNLIKTITRANCDIKVISDCLKEIETNFPKFKKYRDFYIFGEWATRTNQVYAKDNLGISQGAPASIPGIHREDIEKIRKEYIQLKGWKVTAMNSSDFARIELAIKRLINRPNITIDLISEGMKWLSKQRFEWWTLDTLNKQWADFIKNKDQGVPAASREVDLSKL